MTCHLGGGLPVYSAPVTMLPCSSGVFPPQGLCPFWNILPLALPTPNPDTSKAHSLILLRGTFPDKPMQSSNSHPLNQGCQTHFHRGPHKPCGFLQRAEYNVRTV